MRNKYAIGTIAVLVFFVCWTITCGLFSALGLLCDWVLPGDAPFSAKVALRFVVMLPIWFEVRAWARR